MAAIFRRSVCLTSILVLLLAGALLPAVLSPKPVHAATLTRVHVSTTTATYPSVELVVDTPAYDMYSVFVEGANQYGTHVGHCWSVGYGVASITTWGWWWQEDATTPVIAYTTNNSTCSGLPTPDQNGEGSTYIPAGASNPYYSLYVYPD